MVTYQRYWDDEHVQQIFCTESRQKTRELFLQTHHPFTRIRVDFCKEPGSVRSFIAENELAQIIQMGNLTAHNRLFFIVGEAGSGKSELCQWLEYNLDQAHALPIHIPRSQTSAIQVAALLRQHLALHAPDYHTEQIPYELEARFIGLMATMFLYENCPLILEKAQHWEPFFADSSLLLALVKWLVGTTSDPFHLDYHLLYAWLDQQNILHSPSTEAIRQALETLLQLAAERRLWLRDIRELLAKLSQIAIQSGKRPVLLIEDITAFQVVGDLLLDYLLDLTSGHFDAIIGVTSGYEQTQLAHATISGDLTHIHQRLRGRFVLTDDLGQAYGLEENLVDFTQRYLYAIQSSSTSEHPNHALYPFTPTFLHRAYQALHEERNPHKTPRLFLEHVLAAVLTSEQIPPLVLDASHYLERVPQLFRQEDVADENLASLLRWYGDIEQDHIVLDAQIPDWWAVPVAPALIHNGKIRVARTFTSSQLSTTTMMSVAWEQEIRELQQWLDTGGIYPSRETLKRGIERVILSLGDPRVLANPFAQSTHSAQVYYARGDERLPIFLDGESGDVPSTSVYIQIHFSHDRDDRGLLEELAYLHLSGAAIPQACQNSVITLAWAKQHWDAYNTQAQTLLVDALDGVTLPQLVFVSWRLLAYLQGKPWSDSPHIYDSNRETEGVLSPWIHSPHHACYDAGQALHRWHEPVRRLFIGLFLLHDTLLDKEAFQHTQQTTDTLLVLNRLAGLALKSLKSLPYKIRPLGYSLYELLISVKSYAQALMALDVSASLKADLHEIEECLWHLQAQQPYEPDGFAQHIQLLKLQCTDVGITWQNEWTTAIDSLQGMSTTVLDQLINALQQTHALGQQLYAQPDDVWAYQSFRIALVPLLAHSYWHAVQTLDAIQLTLKKTARLRYRRTGKVMTGTKVYRQLLITLDQLFEEIHNG